MLTAAKKRLALSTTLALLCVTFAAAEERALSGTEISASLNDQTLLGANPEDKIEQIFQSTGLTIYIEHGSQSQGQWKVDGDKYCSVWPPSKYWACYSVTQDGEAITFVSSSGERFPMVAKPATE
jgi:hypothetical protein